MAVHPKQFAQDGATDAQAVTWNNSSGVWEPQTPSLPSQIAEATGDITTTSTTDVVATGMTLTPAAGTYLVWFSSTYLIDANEDLFASIWSAGAQVASSERRHDNANNDILIPFCCVARVTVNGSQAIEGRWRVVNASTGTMTNRNLAILRVG